MENQGLVAKQAYSKMAQLCSRSEQCSADIRKKIIAFSTGFPHYTHLLCKFGCKVVIEEEKLSYTIRHLTKAINLAIENNFLFSIPTIINRSSHFQNLVKIVPLKNILTETDAPLLSPFPKKTNEPIFVLESIKKIAQIKQISQKETEKIIFMNFQNTFLLK